MSHPDLIISMSKSQERRLQHQRKLDPWFIAKLLKQMGYIDASVDLEDWLTAQGW